VFHTYNSCRLPTVFNGLSYTFLERRFNVHATIRIEGDKDVEINFGRDVFRRKEEKD
jgi:hypothetical protein